MSVLARSAATRSLTDVRDRLVAALTGTTLELTDGLLGLDLLASLGADSVSVHDARIGFTEAGALRVEGSATLVGLDASVDLTLDDTDDGWQADLHLIAGADAPWGPPSFGLRGVRLDLRRRGAGAHRQLDGALTAATTAGDVVFAVTVPDGSAPWDLAVRLEGPLVGLVPAMVGEALGDLVGADGPVPDLSAVDGVTVRAAVDPRSSRLASVEVGLVVATWSVGPLTVQDASFRLAVTEPFDAAARQVALEATATIAAADVALPIAFARSADGRWSLVLGDELGDVGLAALARAFGGDDVLAAVPSDLVALADVRLASVRAVVDPAATPPARRLGELAVLLHADWELAEGWLHLADGSLAFTVHEPLSSPTRRFEAELGGTVVLGGLAFTVGAVRRPAEGDAAGGWTLHGLLPPGPPLDLATALGGFTGGAVALPPELPALALESLAVEADTATGAFTLTGRATAGWSLPLGDGFTAAAVDVHVERGARPAPGVDAPVAVALTVRAEGRVDVAEGFAATAATLTFALDTAAGTWSVGGALDAEVFDEAVTFTVALDADGASRRLVLQESATDPTGGHTVDLGGAGSLTLRDLRVELVRSATASAPVTPGDPVPPAPRPTYAWSLAAAGHLDVLTGTLVVDGTVTLAGAPGSLTFSLEPAGDAAGRLDVTLPGTADVGLHLALGHLRVRRVTRATGRAAWTLHADPSLWFSGLPGDLATVLPSSADAALRTVLATGADGSAAPSVTIDVERVLPRTDIALPSFALLGDTVALGTAAVEIGALGVRWTAGGGLGVDVALAVGLPSQLNDVLAGGHRFFTTFDPATGDGLVGARLTATVAGSAPSLQLALLDSPLAAMAFDAVDPAAPAAPRRATIDLGPCGTLTLDVPTLTVEGDVVRARGGFRQRGLALPLGPLAWLLRALDLDRLAALLPAALPLRDLPIVSALGHLDVDALVDLLADVAGLPAGTTVPARDELARALAPLADAVDELPERLLPYLDIHVPEAFSFDLAVSATGAVRGTIAVAGADGATGRAVEPLRLVLPGLGVTGPVLTGISLWRLSIGEVLGGAAVVADVDADVEQFDLLPVAIRLAAPPALRAELPPTRPLVRRVVADRLTIVAVPAALVALPLFFDDLAVEHHGIEGVELAAHLRVPHPSLDLAGAVRLFRQLQAFVTDRDAELAPDALAAAGLDLRLVAGPAFVQLPDYLGGQLLGSRTATSEVSATDALVHLLNGLKRLRFDDLVRALPDELRHGTLAAGARTGIGPIGVTGSWRVDAPSDGRRGIDIVVDGGAVAGPLTLAHGSLAVRTAGASDVRVEVQVGGGTRSLVGVELDATVDTGAQASAAGGALVLRDPTARVVADGPTGRPTAFTVEWWMCPTELADYDQFVAADSAWGAFVFHATATGAVYCGTDVATRLTPAQLPAGTLARGVWQHIAVTFAGDRLTVLRDGVVLATRTGVSAPRPWTGLHLGMPQAGTQVAGGITELRIWDSARPAAAIAADRARRLTGAEPGLVAYWPLDDSGPVFHDASGHGCHARLTAGTAAAVAGSPLPPAPLDPAAPRAHATGDATLTLFGHTVARGSIDIGRDRAVLGAQLDLFGDDPTLRVRGRVQGDIGRDHLLLDGALEVAVAGLVLSDTRAHVTEQSLELHGRWLGAFAADLAIDARLGRRVFAGHLTGSVPVTIAFPPQYVPTPNGPAKMCDGFTVASAFQVDLAVQVGEAMGFNAVGTATFQAGGVTHSLTLQLSTPPASLAALTSVLTNLVLPRARELFQSLYPSVDAWVRGMATGAFAWTRTAWTDTATTLRSFFGITAAQAVSLLDASAYDAVDIGRVLSSAFTTGPTAMAYAFAGAAADVTKAARATFALFEAPFGRDAVTQANSVAAMLKGAYGTMAVGTTIGTMFPIGAFDGVRILTQQGFPVGEVATVARQAWSMSANQTASALASAGVAAEGALQAVRTAFPELAADALGGVLVAAGYARSVVNDVLQRLRPPGL